MRKNELVVVTASASAERLGVFACNLNTRDIPIVAVTQRMQGAPVQFHHGILDDHEDYLGVVPAFARGCELALRAYPEANYFACLHDDVLLQDSLWAEQVVAYFASHPRCGLLGFGGAAQLGEDDIQTTPYSPYKLVRKRFLSNMNDAEVHGARVTTPRRIAVLDGFSQVFDRHFLRGSLQGNRFAELESWGVVHHAYDAALGALAARSGFEVHLLPLSCTHLGGQTAVGDGRYSEWAVAQIPTGDQGFWEAAHRIVYDRCRTNLPIIVPQPEDQ
jgi:hypothetical protein